MSQVLKLEELDGVGPHLAESIRKHFRGEASFFEAAKRMDLEALCAVDGVSERKAVELVRQVKGQRGAAQADRFLATPATRKVHDDIMERLGEFAATRHGRNRLRLLAPLSTPKEALAHIQTVLSHKAQVATLDRDQVRRLLRRLQAPSEPRPTRALDRIVICEDGATQDRLESQGAAAWVNLAGLEALERAVMHDLVVFLYDEGADLEGLDNVVELPATASLAEIIPERTVGWFQAHRASLEACAELGRVFGRPERASEALALLEATQRQQLTPAAIRASIEAARKQLESDIRERLASISLQGDDILAALTSKAPPALQKALDECLAAARKKLQADTGLSFQPFSALPVSVDEREVERIERQVESKGRAEAYLAKAKAAKQLAGIQEAVRQEILGWLDFDAAFALGCFALHYDLRAPAFEERLACEGSVHLNLADKPDAQRIRYELGGAHPVALLTGANSGGKTTLLEHLCQLVVMARLGLPVVGDVIVPWVDEVHSISNRRSLDAGAFESFLRGFLPLAEGDAKRLILADEVESVTELEAAGRIIGFFIDRVVSRGSLTLLVSHMADAILRHTEANIRIDGIEATGLDAELRLVVDRVPRMGHLARSTPELIVQRLCATSKGAEQGLYRDLLARFAAAAPAKPPSRRPASRAS